jgi:polysaccharide deacetylase family protein (PEP-CTERM system associated)
MGLPRAMKTESTSWQFASAPAKALRNILSVDLEDWYHGLELPETDWPIHNGRIEQTTRRLLKIFAEEKVKATFFVLGCVAERHPELVEEIFDAGHEIGTHGWSHNFVYRQTPARFRNELQRSISLLEDIVGIPVLGHRAAFFSITNESLWALEIVAERGLRYDSSIFPAWNYRYGIRTAPRFPFELKFDERTLIEVPLSTLRLPGQNLPVGGGAYFRLLPYFLTHAAFRHLNRRGRSGVFYIHPWEIDPEHPKLALHRRIGFTHYHKLKETEARLRKLLRNFQFAPIREVLGLATHRANKAPSVLQYA